MDSSVSRKRAVNAMYLDFIKSFHTASYAPFITNSVRYKLDKWINKVGGNLDCQNQKLLSVFQSSDCSYYLVGFLRDQFWDQCCLLSSTRTVGYQVYRKHQIRRADSMLKGGRLAVQKNSGKSESQGSDPFVTYKTVSGVVCPVWCFPVQKQHWHIGVSLAEDLS